MRTSSRRSRVLLGLAAAGIAVCACLAAPRAAQAQVVVLVNGQPVTEMDIAQRIKLMQLSNNKSASRKEAMDDLINDHLKVFIAKRYGLDVSDAEVNQAFGRMAQRSHATPAQLEQSLTQRGIGVANLKLRIRADVGWGQLVRGKYVASLQVGEADIRNALQARGEDDKNAPNYIYTVYPVIVVGAQGNDAEAAARRKEAEALRARFNSCDQDLKMARTMRGVVVKEPILRESSDLSAQTRDVLDKMEIGKLTPPELTQQGVQMFAVCNRKPSAADSPLRRQVREELFNKRFETESKKWLQELRKQALIEYRQPQPQ